MIEKNEKYPETSPCQPCKKPWIEYLLEMEKAYNTLRHSMGSYAFDHNFAYVKGYMEGYIAGMNKMKHELDL